MSLKTEIAAINKNYNKNLKEFKQALKECLSVEDFKKGWYINSYITPALNRDLKKLPLKTVKEKILNTYTKRKEKQKIKDIEHMNAVFSSSDIKEIRLQIEWKKNQTWGANPTANVEIYLNDDNKCYEYFTSGSIGGCGYCKQSTAFAEAINQSLSLQKLLLSKKGRIKDIYGHRGGRLSGGVGVSCYPSIFEKLGYKMITTATGKMFDAYLIVKK